LQLQSPKEELFLIWFEIYILDYVTNYLIVTVLVDTIKLKLNDGTLNKLGNTGKGDHFAGLNRQKKLVYAFSNFTYK
jgi:hypothetical protein